MELTTERLHLVPLGTAHFITAHRYASDLENTKLMLFLPTADEADSMQYLAEREAQWQTQPQMIFEFAILLDGVHIGSVSLDRLEPPCTGELGWIVDKHYWGHGYAVEAARAMLPLAASLGMERLIAHCDSENHASRRVMEKLGMKLAGISGGRKNRSSGELRQECLYVLELSPHIALSPNCHGKKNT